MGEIRVEIQLIAALILSSRLIFLVTWQHEYVH